MSKETSKEVDDDGYIKPLEREQEMDDYFTKLHQSIENDQYQEMIKGQSQYSDHQLEISQKNKPLFKLTPEQVADIKHSAKDTLRMINRKKTEASLFALDGIPHSFYIPHTFNKQNSLFIFEECDFKNYKNGMSDGFMNISFYPDINKDYHVDYCVSERFYEKQEIASSTISLVRSYIEDLDKEKNINIIQVKDYLDKKLIPISDRQLETAQKTGYVQGVCESVLAFNTDENRKIMSEATMTFLSKKLLTQMNVTKDMAQKFANPETYKALEQFVFSTKQEQRLEQTQSQGRSF